ncbi:metallophosphoesterase [Rhizobium rhizogenes]|uniref:metallophosphoesterase family protein n=1 Tax=Rhizobium rhizogenes TaxID=359 RepID=UPI00226F8E0B|nr:metallophosphoesterase [Rhizobium rhizogenes]
MSVNPIPSLLPRGPGHRFVLYGDSCSGVSGALHEGTFAAVNSVLRRLDPPPEFILFPGDEIIGLTADPEALRAQWRHWLDQEMAWFDRQATPIWHTTGNHTTYDEMSEQVFREVLQLPENGPPGQEGLSYWVRHGDLLLVFVNTLWTGLGGEGHVETEWLEATLKAHTDVRHKIVLGHHPVFPVNGFAGAYQREIGPEYARRFWDILVEADVFAYVCSHILAFDVQVHRGVLQLCTAGAGTAHRMPEGVEYLHCIQAALDEEGLRYQVLDTEGAVREQLQWPFRSAENWRNLPHGSHAAAFAGFKGSNNIVELRIAGLVAEKAHAPAQTLFSAFDPQIIAPLWLGLRGPRQTLTLILGRKPGRSPHYWFGPNLPPGQPFDIDIALHAGMGPGGMLYRMHGDDRWNSFRGASATGLEEMIWPGQWSVGHGQGGPADRPFMGSSLAVQIGYES